MRVLVTGGTGLVGSVLCERLSGEGHDVIALGRHRPGATASPVAWMPYRLPGAIPPEALSPGPSIVIHAAWETVPAEPGNAYDVNVSGARVVLDACRAHAAKLVFISSTSAHEDAESLYGRGKLAVERLLDPARDLVVRPGLVIGMGGLYGRIRAAVRLTRVVPLFFGGTQRIQTIAADDLASGICRAIRRDLSGSVTIAEPDPVRLRELYSAIAHEAGTRPVFVPIPGAAGLLVLRAAEALRLRLPVTSENLLGLKHLRAFDVHRDLELLDLDPKPMRASVRWAERAYASAATLATRSA
jgi:NADH dehydrogenase